MSEKSRVDSEALNKLRALVVDGAPITTILQGINGVEQDLKSSLLWQAVMDEASNQLQHAPKITPDIECFKKIVCGFILAFANAELVEEHPENINEFVKLSAALHMALTVWIEQVISIHGQDILKISPERTEVKI